GVETHCAGNARTCSRPRRRRMVSPPFCTSSGPSLERCRDRRGKSRGIRLPLHFLHGGDARRSEILHIDPCVQADARPVAPVRIHHFPKGRMEASSFTTLSWPSRSLDQPTIQHVECNRNQAFHCSPKKRRLLGKLVLD